MKKFAVILFAALALTFAAASGAQAKEPLPIVYVPVVSSPAGTPPDYDHCLIHPPCKGWTVPPGYFGPVTTSGRIPAQ